MDIKTIIKVIYLSFLLFFTVKIQPVFAEENNSKNKNKPNTKFNPEPNTTPIKDQKNIDNHK